jgi:hypothetical protein
MESMGYKRRERQRRRKARVAREAAAKQSQANGDGADKDWLTPAPRKTRCMARGCSAPNLEVGRDVVVRYSRSGRLERVVCLFCADRLGIKFLPSRRWELHYAKDRAAKRMRGDFAR